MNAPSSLQLINELIAPTIRIDFLVVVVVILLRRSLGACCTSFSLRSGSNADDLLRLGTSSVVGDGAPGDAALGAGALA